VHAALIDRRLDGRLRWSRLTRTVGRGPEAKRPSIAGRLRAAAADLWMSTPATAARYDDCVPDPAPSPGRPCGTGPPLACALRGRDGSLGPDDPAGRASSTPPPPISRRISPRLPPCRRGVPSSTPDARWRQACGRASPHGALP